MLYSVAGREVGSRSVAEPSLRYKGALPSQHSLVRPCRAHSLAPAARLERRRAQRMSMMARQRHPQGHVIDRSEHAGSFGWNGVRTGGSTRKFFNYPGEKPIECRVSADGCVCRCLQLCDTYVHGFAAAAEEPPLVWV